MRSRLYLNVTGILLQDWKILSLQAQSYKHSYPLRTEHNFKNLRFKLKKTLRLRQSFL